MRKSVEMASKALPVSIITVFVVCMAWSYHTFVVLGVWITLWTVWFPTMLTECDWNVRCGNVCSGYRGCVDCSVMIVAWRKQFHGFICWVENWEFFRRLLFVMLIRELISVCKHCDMQMMVFKYLRYCRSHAMCIFELPHAQY